MTPTPILIDCDPGHDDAIALLLALGSPEVELPSGDAVLCQLEIPDEAVVSAWEGTTGLFCLNAAPARPVAVDPT